MSVLFRTLQNLRDGVADVADVTIAASGVRHTNALVDARINRAVQRWWRMMAESGDDSMLSRFGSTTTPLNPILSMGTVYSMYIRGVDIWDGATQTGQSTPLLPMDYAARGQDVDVLPSGKPMFYSLAALPALNPVQLWPTPDAAYAVQVLYIPAPSALVNDTDVVEVLSGGEDWIINDAAISTLRTDGLADSATMQLLISQNQKLEQDMRFMAACRGYSSKVDTVGQRAALIRGSWWKT